MASAAEGVSRSCMSAAAIASPAAGAMAWPMRAKSESPLDRSIRRARNIRMRLGGAPSILEPLPNKPRRMHRLTYYRLFGKAEAAQERWTGLSRVYLRRL